MARHAQMTRYMRETHSCNCNYTISRYMEVAKMCGCGRTDCITCGFAKFQKRIQAIEQNAKITTGYLSGGPQNKAMP